MADETPVFRTPGQLVQSLLDERGWTQSVLAVVLGMSPTVVTRIINGQRPVDAKTAIALSEVFGVQPGRFLVLQGTYDLAKAKIETVPDPGRAVRARLYSDLPVKEMARRGWIDVKDILDVRAVEKALTDFFRVTSPDEIEIMPHASKKTGGGENVTPAQVAWLYRVRKVAENMVVAKYSTSAMQGAIKKLRNLLASPEEARKVPGFWPRLACVS